MTNTLIITFIVITLVLSGGLVWVILEQRKLKQDYERLGEGIERNNKDIAGLCSAAVSVDNRIVNNDEQLKQMVTKMAGFEENEKQINQPYQSAIQKVHQGANVEELVQLCSLSREEAELLIRLHRCVV